MALFKWLTDAGAATRLGVWTGVTAGDEVPPARVDEAVQYLSLAVIKRGAFGGPVAILGSLDPDKAPDSFLPMRDVWGRTLSRILLPELVTVYGSVTWIKPEPGEGVKDLTVYLLGQR